MMAALPIIFLFGPTASGKTDLAISLTKDFSFGLISVDACQVYRGLDIGTAKPSPSLLSQYPHALINVRDPSESFSAGDFCRESAKSIDGFLERDQIPMLVGGSMFYFSALTRGLGPASGANQDLRYRIKQEGDKYGWPALHRKLVAVNPRIAKAIHPNDQYRIQRALEIYEESQKSTRGARKMTPRIPTNIRILRLGIAISDRSLLHRRIEQRVDAMLDEGLLAEVEGVLERGIDPETPALRSVGYRQACEYLRGSFSYSAMRDQINSATRQFAKRQLTWMRNTRGTVWFDAGEPDVAQHVGRYLRNRLSTDLGKSGIN